MSKATTTIGMIVSAVLICGGLGCVASSKWITPAAIDPGAVKYVERAGVADPNDYMMGWANLLKAESLAGAVDASHKKIQLSLRQRIEADDLEYAIHKDAVAKDVEKAQALENMFFSEDGMMTMGMSMIGVGGLAGLAGLMRKRPGDWDQASVDKALADAGADGQIKGAQIVEIVKGIENLKANLPDGVWDQLKGKISEKMSSGTKEIVAAAKATL